MWGICSFERPKDDVKRLSELLVKEKVIEYVQGPFATENNIQNSNYQIDIVDISLEVLKDKTNVNVMFAVIVDK